MTYTNKTWHIYMLVQTLNTRVKYYKINLNRWWVISRGLLIIGTPCTGCTGCLCTP